MPAEPITAAVATSINLAFKLADFILKVAQAKEDIDVFARLIKRVQQDREEALRERQATNEILERSPEKLQWINTALSDVDYALQVIGRIIENARIDTARGKKVSLKHRFEWVLTHKDEFMAKQTLLSTCHTSLVAALNYLHGIAHGITLQSTSTASLLEDEDSDESQSIMGPSARRSRLQHRGILPDSLKTESLLIGKHLKALLDTADDLVDLWEPMTISAVDVDQLSRQGSAKDSLSCNEDQIDDSRDAGDYITTRNSTTASVQSTQLDIRRRRREATYLNDDDDVADDSVSERSLECVSINRDMRPPVVHRRESMMSRRRNIAAHFHD